MTNISENFIELKKAIKVLSERVEVAPDPPTPIPLLSSLIVDVNSLVTDIYTLSQEIKETNAGEMVGELDHRKRRNGCMGE